MDDLAVGESCIAARASYMPQRSLSFFATAIFSTTGLGRDSIFCSSFVSRRMKVKTCYSLSFRPLPVFGHRTRSSWRACFRGSIDFYSHLAISCRGTSPRTVDPSIDRSLTVLSVGHIDPIVSEWECVVVRGAL